MLLGKRPRDPIKRTTSMSEITFDLDTTDTTETNNPASDFFLNQRQPPPAFGDQRFLASTVSPRNHRRTSADLLETAQFLRACSLCKRRLTPGRDIYMYRGDSAFCSLECRQQQMNQDERKEKCSIASNKEAVPSNATDISTKGETVAAL